MQLLKLIRTHDPDQTHPRATQQGCIKCRCHITVPAVPTQEAIPEEGDHKKYLVDLDFQI